jgi:hypothetical protein
MLPNSCELFVLPVRTRCGWTPSSSSDGVEMCGGKSSSKCACRILRRRSLAGVDDLDVGVVDRFRRMDVAGGGLVDGSEAVVGGCIRAAAVNGAVGGGLELTVGVFCIKRRMSSSVGGFRIRRRISSCPSWCCRSVLSLEDSPSSGLRSTRGVFSVCPPGLVVVVKSRFRGVYGEWVEVPPRADDRERPREPFPAAAPL